MYNPIIPYANFTQFTPALPEFYWNVYSAEQRIKHICYEIFKLAKYSDYLTENLNLDHETINELQKEFEKFVDGQYDEFYEQKILEWIRDNMPELMRYAITQVYFGLTDDGHFVAYIPESWSDIVFDTGHNYALDTYGRLILRMDVDSPYNVNQTPEVVRPYDDAPALQQQIDNLMESLYNTEG